METIGGTGDEVVEEEAVVMVTVKGTGTGMVTMVMDMGMAMDLEGVVEAAAVEEEEVVVEEDGSMVTGEFRLEVMLEPQELSALGRSV